MADRCLNVPRLLELLKTAAVLRHAGMNNSPDEATSDPPTASYR
jgi:hypothetical protein